MRALQAGLPHGVPALPVLLQFALAGADYEERSGGEFLFRCLLLDNADAQLQIAATLSPAPSTDDSLHTDETVGRCVRVRACVRACACVHGSPRA